jgi:hypothetical protein
MLFGKVIMLLYLYMGNEGSERREKREGRMEKIGLTLIMKETKR